MNGHDNYPMSPEAFDRWIETMRSTGRAKTQTEMYELLGLSKWGWYLMKQRGMVNRRTALAMSALAIGIKPWE